MKMHLVLQQKNNLLSSADFSGNDTADPEESVSPHDSSLHSRDTNTIHSKDQRNDQKEKNGNNKDEPSPMDFDDNDKADNKNNKPDDKPEGKTRKRSRGHYYNPLVYYKGNKGKTYFYQYFKPYSYDYRMLQNDEKGEPIECLCPRGKIHLSKCPWYNPDII